MGFSSRVRRHKEREIDDLSIAHQILDEAMICHVGVVRDEQPVIIPMIPARIGEVIYLHGAPAMGIALDAKHAADGQPTRVSITATIVDGLVLARSHFDSSLNYRSAMFFGTARLVTDEDEKATALRAIADHITPGRWELARLPSEKELRATAVIALDVEEFSVKVRTGPPVDEPEDIDGPWWAGVVPVTIQLGEAQPAPDLPPPIAGAGPSAPWQENTTWPPAK